MKKNYETSLQKTREKASEVVAKAIEAANEKSSEKHHELDELLNKKLKEAEKNISKAQVEAVNVFTPVAAEISKQIVAKLTGMTVSENDADKVVKKLLKGV